MECSCFSPEVERFLLDERAHLGAVFEREQYDCIIEVGCHAGHNAEWLASLCARYVGVDISREAIEFARRRHVSHGEIDFLCTSVEMMLPLIFPGGHVPRRAVVLFPFNLFGNFVNAEEIIEIIGEAGLDMAMSNFNTRSETTIGRYNYYASCFDRGVIRVYDSKQGVLFKVGRAFRSIAYDVNYLTKIVHQNSRYHAVIGPFSAYGDLLLLTK